MELFCLNRRLPAIPCVDWRGAPLRLLGSTSSAGPDPALDHFRWPAMDAVTRVLPRAATGVAGLDSILGGGLARNRLHLLEGSPGTGKTTIALQFLMAGAEA